MRILVVGGSGDIGQGILDVIPTQEHLVGAHYFKNKKYHYQVEWFQADLRDTTQNIQLIKDFVDWADGIDVLIIASGGRFENWKEDVELNLMSPYILSNWAMKFMKKNHELNKIIFIGTASALHGAGNKNISYGLAKAGLVSLTKAMARDGSKYNILVNCIAPGYIETKSQKKWKTEEEIKKRIEMIPLGRAGTTRDIGELVWFLVSEKNRFINGQYIQIDGGDWL